MKKFLMAAMCLIVATSAVSAKHRDKYIIKECRNLQKEGWRVSPCTMPMYEQLSKSYQMEYEYENIKNKSIPKYIMATATSDTCNSFAEAEVEAELLARISILVQLHSEGNVNQQGADTISIKTQYGTYIITTSNTIKNGLVIAANLKIEFEPQGGNIVLYKCMNTESLHEVLHFYPTQIPISDIEVVASMYKEISNNKCIVMKRLAIPNPLINN